MGRKGVHVMSVCVDWVAVGGGGCLFVCVMGGLNDSYCVFRVCCDDVFCPFTTAYLKIGIRCDTA